MTNFEGDLHRQLAAAADRLRAALQDDPPLRSGPSSGTVRVAPGVSPVRRKQLSVSKATTVPGTSEDIPALVRLVDAMSDRVIANAAGQVEALRRLTGLRRVNQELQDCFHALEKRLPADAHRPDLVYCDNPQPDEAGTALEWNSVGLVQVLPVSSEGISAFQLCFRDIEQGQHAVLHVHLTAVEDRRVVDRWTVPLQRVEAGWTTFGLNKAIAGPSSTLELRLNLEGGQDARMTLCNGAQQPVRQFQVRRGTPTAAPRPHGMAIRVWCGSAHTVGANFIVADSRKIASANRIEVPLAPMLLERATHEDAGEAKFEFPPVKNVPNQVAVEVHPPARGMTVAHIPLPGSIWPYAVSAETYIQNPKSKTIEFAMVLADGVERARAILAGAGGAEAYEGFSGWKATSVDAPGLVCAEIAGPARKRPKLFVATRMQTPGDNFFAWARLRKVTIRVGAL